MGVLAGCLRRRKRDFVVAVSRSGVGVDVGLAEGDEVVSCGKVFVFSRVANGSGGIWVFEKKKGGGLFKRPVLLRKWKKV